MRGKETQIVIDELLEAQLQRTNWELKAPGKSSHRTAFTCYDIYLLELDHTYIINIREKSPWAFERNKENMPEHSVLNKACPQGKPVNQSLTDLGKGNTQVQSTLAILFHLGVAGGGGGGVRKKLKNTTEVHSPEA